MEYTRPRLRSLSRLHFVVLFLLLFCFFFFQSIWKCLGNETVEGYSNKLIHDDFTGSLIVSPKETRTPTSSIKIFKIVHSGLLDECGNIIDVLKIFQNGNEIRSSRKSTKKVGTMLSIIKKICGKCSYFNSIIRLSVHKVKQYQLTARKRSNLVEHD